MKLLLDTPIFLWFISGAPDYRLRSEMPFTKRASRTETSGHTPPGKVRCGSKSSLKPVTRVGTPFMFQPYLAASVKGKRWKRL